MNKELCEGFWKSHYLRDHNTMIKFGASSLRAIGLYCLLAQWDHIIDMAHYSMYLYRSPYFTLAVECKLPADIKIKDLTPEDSESVMEVAKESWKWAYAGIYSEEFINSWLQKNYSRERLIQQITASQLLEDTFFIGAFNYSKLVGFIHFGVSGRTAELLRLYLKPYYTRREIGSKLLEEIERLIAGSGVTKFILYVHHNNKVRASFYRKKGFLCRGNNGDDIITTKKYEFYK